MARAFEGITGRALAQLFQFDGSLCDVAAGGDELDGVGIGKKSQHAATRRGSWNSNAFAPGAEIFLVPKVEDVHPLSFRQSEFRPVEINLIRFVSVKIEHTHDVIAPSQ